MSRARGFTLVEVVLALVLTGVVALLCYGAISAATDTRDRLAEDREARLADGAWRGFLSEVIRGARTPREYDAPTLIVQHGPTAGGVSTDRLALVTSSGAAPLSPGADWRILFSVEPEGIVARASPLGPWRDSRVVRGPTGIAGLGVEVLTADGWLASWDSDLELPLALRIWFHREDGTRGAPLVVVIPTGGVR